MKIVYLIGNGFDLRLGFKTSYPDFLDFYKMGQATEKVEPWKKLFFERLEEKGENWSDLELALGEFTADFEESEAGVQTFRAFYFDLQRNLTYYLKEQGEVSNVSYGELSKFIDDLCRPWIHLRSNKQRQRLLKPSIVESSTYTIEIISFNYTNYFEEVRNLAASHSSRIAEASIHYIHRRLKDRGILFGLDSVVQIANEYFRKHLRIREWLVKPYCSKEVCEDEAMEVCEEKIKEADLICIFGSSMGVTDKTWWQLIGEQVEAGTPLIRFIYDKEANNEFDQLINEEEELHRQETLEALCISAPEETYRDRIFVPINSEMFPERNS